MSPVDIKNIKALAKELQFALPFDSEGISSEEEYASALSIADELTNNYDNSYTILLDVLWPVIQRYEEISPEFSEFNVRLAKMDTNKKAEQKLVLEMAFNNACYALNVSDIEKNQMLKVVCDINDMQLYFVRLYRSLFAIADGDNDFMIHWYHTNNKALNGVPAELCVSADGVAMVNQYLDEICAKG